MNADEISRWWRKHYDGLLAEYNQLKKENEELKAQPIEINITNKTADWLLGKLEECHQSESAQDCTRYSMEAWQLLHYARKLCGKE